MSEPQLGVVSRALLSQPCSSFTNEQFNALKKEITETDVFKDLALYIENQVNLIQDSESEGLDLLNKYLLEVATVFMKRVVKLLLKNTEDIGQNLELLGDKVGLCILQCLSSV